MCTIFHENVQVLKGIILPSCQDFFPLSILQLCIENSGKHFHHFMNHMENLSLLQFFFRLLLSSSGWWGGGELHLVSLAARMKISVWRRADFLKIKKKKKLAASGNSPFDRLINTFQMFEWCGHSLREEMSAREPAASLMQSYVLILRKKIVKELSTLNCFGVLK